MNWVVGMSGWNIVVVGARWGTVMSRGSQGNDECDDVWVGHPCPIRASSKCRCYSRSSLRITSFNPDQVSSTAHTFTSTSLLANAYFLTTSSVISVVTPDDFLGQDIQIMPSRTMRFRRLGSRFCNCDALSTKEWMKFNERDWGPATSTEPGSGPRSFR